MLSVDFETRSKVDLPKTGVYVYASDPSTSILCMAWAIGDDDPSLWVPGNSIPSEFKKHVVDGAEVRAWNAAFERIIWTGLLAKIHGFPMPRFDQFVCTAAEAAAMALPRSLGMAAQVLGTARKDKRGDYLIKMCCEPTKDGGWLEDEDPELYARLFVELGMYCLQDVRAERAIAKRVRRLGPQERRIYLLDQTINDRGIGIDLPLVHRMQTEAIKGTDAARAEAEVLTEGEITNIATQHQRLAKWLTARGFETATVGKVYLKETLVRDDLPPVVREVLEIRQSASKSSIAKLDATLRSVCRDARARGLLLYHAASTGRWAGRLIQPQNFPRGEVKNANRHIPALMRGESFDLTTLSSMLRGIFKAKRGHVFYSGDFSQIEARVLGWLANEPYLDKEYERMASAIYDLPVEKVGKGSEEREIGKRVVLGCGFQMGGPTFQENCWIQGGIRIKLSLAKKAVHVYRAAKPNIVTYWRLVYDAAVAAVEEPGSIQRLPFGVAYVVRGQCLWCILPSGRPLAYSLPRMKLRNSKYGPRIGLEFSTYDSQIKRWVRKHAYGGLLVENIVQATARDILAAAMLRVEEAGYPVVLTVHDEILSEPRVGRGSLKEFRRIMEVKPPWVGDCPIVVDSWEGPRYRK